MFQKVLVGAWVLVTFGCLLAAQDTPTKQDDQPGRYYRLDFSVKDMQDGKLLGARNYFVYLSDRKNSRPCNVRVDSKVTMPAGKTGDYREFSLGMGIDCAYESETKDTLALNVGVNVNTLVPYEDKSEPDPVPIVRSNRWNADVLVTLRKPTTIFSSDDIASNRKLQVELTATPILQ